jgi:hypothetical protein
MQETKFNPELMHAATHALAGKQKALHIHIEPTENHGFIASHQDHEDGMPVGSSRKHALSGVKELVKHLQEHYKNPMLEKIKAQGAESEAGETKQPAEVQDAAQGE